MSRRRRPRIAAVGLATWDQIIVVDHFPHPGSNAIVRGCASLPGGTTTNSAVALARLGVETAIVALVGDDAAGAAFRTGLEAEGINTEFLMIRAGEPTDAATIVTVSKPPGQTIFWHQGARLVRGDRLDVPAIFGHDVVLLDVDDAPLRRFLVDLPAHTLPTTRLLGTLTYLADAGLPDAFALAMRHDAIVGSEREYLSITGEDSLAAALSRIQVAMPGANLRACIASRGANGSVACTATEQWSAPAFPIEVVDTTGAGDAFAAGVAYGMALRWDWPRSIRFANAVGALSTRALGAQAALPSLPEVASLLGDDPTTLSP